MLSPPRTMLEKIWDARAVVPETQDAPAVLAVDLHLVHEVTSPQAFAALRARGLGVRRPDLTLATVDHSIPTAPPVDDGALPIFDDGQAAAQIRQLERNCREAGIELLGVGDPGRGIVHVIGPELGATQPGMTIVCGDSHTSTHGAFGALAFGVGTSEVAQALATQCVLQRRPEAMLIDIRRRLGFGVTAKDLALALISRVGVAGGSRCAIEYAGETVEALSMEGRMTLCNMSIEAGARAGMVAPDAVTERYLKGRQRAPSGSAWDRGVERWRELPSDTGARFDRAFAMDASEIEPMATWGVDPSSAAPIGGRVPEPDGDASAEKAIEYMDAEPGERIAGRRVDVVFIGSCTNARLEDLRAAARVLEGRSVAKGVRALAVPGSQAVKRAAEAEGIADVFTRAGFEWRESGCSMCIAMNGDAVPTGRFAVSTSNRNFQGRQGPGARTALASPLTAAASAVTGVLTDPRELLDAARAQPTEGDDT